MTTREERIEAMAMAITEKSLNPNVAPNIARDWDILPEDYKKDFRRLAAAAYDALLAMGAIVEHSGEFVARIVGAQRDHIPEVGKCLKSNGNMAEQKD